MASSLRETIPPGSLTDLVMLEPEEIDALDHLVTGGVSHRDLVLAEHAVRGLVLYPRVVPPFGDFPESLLEVAKEIQTRFEFPSFSTDDPALPPFLQQELAACPEMLSEYFCDAAQAVGEHGGGIFGASFSPSDSEAHGTLARPDGTRVRVPIPAARAVMESSLDRQQRAIALALAYLGGAALFGRRSDLIPQHPAFGGLLVRIDDWFDPPTIREYAPVEIRLPPFLQLVLARASRRSEILEAVLELRKELISGATKFHQMTSRLSQPTTPHERQRIAREMNAEVLRWNALTPVADHQRRVRIRGLGIKAAAALAAIFGDVSPELIAVALAAGGLVNDAAGAVAKIDPSLGLSGALADRLHTELSRVLKLHGEALLKKHLTEAEILEIGRVSP